MVAEDITNVVSRFWLEFFNDPDDPTGVDEIFAPDYTLHNLAYGEDCDLAQLKDILYTIHGKLGGTRVTIEDQVVAEKNRVITRLALHVPIRYAPEEVRASAPVDSELEYKGMSVSRVYEGRIEESWLIWEAPRAEDEIEEPPEDWWRWPPWR